MGFCSGDTFGDYKVIRRLGKGGMGEVWLLEGKSGRLVAAKILDPAAADDPNARRRFLREAELALGVRHPNLVETYDVGEDPETGLCYILMEYVPGGTLARRLKKTGRFPIDEAISVVSSIATVLELGRRKGIVHRDIKPANIMFDAEGTPKLSDLGIARAGLGTETTTVTQTGVMIGTPAYMSPEQMLDSHNVDTRADIYSLGVVFYEMLAGERPNKGDTPVELMAKAIRGEPIPDVRKVRPDVSPALAGLVNRMVAPNKEQRIATPAQVKNALAGIVRGGKFGAGTAPARRKKGSSAERRRSVREFVLFVCLLAACLIIFHLYRERTDTHVEVQAQTNDTTTVVTNVVPPPKPKPEPVVTNVPAVSPKPIPPPPPKPEPVVTNVPAVSPKPIPPPPPKPEPVVTNVPAVSPKPIPPPKPKLKPVVTNVPPAPKPISPPPKPAPPPPKPAPPPPKPVPPPKPPAASSRVTVTRTYIPYSKGWFGDRFPKEVSCCDPFGCTNVIVRENGHYSVRVFPIKSDPDAICSLTICADGNQRVVSFLFDAPTSTVEKIEIEGSR